MRIRGHNSIELEGGYLTGGQPTVRKCSIPLLLMTILFVFTLAFPTQTAFATQIPYTCPELNTIAQAQTDGSLHVVEQRTFNFDDDVDVVFWKFSGLNSNAEISVSTVRMASINDEGVVQGDWINLKEVGFQPNWREPIKKTDGVSVRDSAWTVSGERISTLESKNASESAAAHNTNSADMVLFPEGDVWSFDKRQGTLYAFFDATSTQVIFEIDYIAENAAMAFDDVAELYWDYVPAYNIQTTNINVMIQLPVPEGAIVEPGENVLAWGHGVPGEVAVNADGTIQYYAPLVEPDQYAQAHVVFPVSWLINLDPEMNQLYTGTRLDSAIAEERAWTDTWSNQQINGFALNIAVICICVVALAIAIILYLIFGRERKETDGLSLLNAENELSELPPAVVDRLLRWNHESTEDVYRTTQDLEDRGLIHIDKTSDTARIHIGSNAKSADLTPIEHETMNLLFDVFAEGYRTVSCADISKFKAEHPKQYEEAMNKWQQTLSQEVNAAQLFDATSFKLQKRLAYAAIIFGVASIVSATAFGNWISFAMFLVTAACLAVIANYIPRRTPKGAILAEIAESIDSEAINESNENATATAVTEV